MTTVSFSSDWSHQQSGDIRSGEPFRIEYATERLPQHRAERYGKRAWSILVHLRFHPSGEVGTGDVSSGACEVDAPANTSRIELWFNNTDHTGGSSWDSRYGQNYWLDVKADR
ncbi:DUF6209 family protein [Sorangium sp. So ce1151]|uniref:DUF6209 family protein n=1 Tax=Sorangium sp. So ce1151 TaxID=3133332 RepID=UPI003F6488C6